MKIDGVSAEPSQGDNPFAMGPVALDIDCDLDVLAHKVRTGGSKALGISVEYTFALFYQIRSYCIDCLHERVFVSVLEKLVLPWLP